jgi:hypothetical protein
MICADDARVACPLFQAEYGGSKPTSALQLVVRKVPPKIASELNARWHSRLPEIKNYKMCFCYSAEFSNVFYAVALMSHPVASGLNGQGIVELRRMAIAPDAPKNTGSRFLRIMVALLRRDRPEFTKIISYQDTEVHTGAIYKAAGWSAVENTHKGGACGWDNNARRRTESNGKAPLLAKKIRWEKCL